MGNKNYHHGNLREALLVQSMTLLYAEGVDSLSMRRIAREVGVSAPSVYHHFSNRTDLLVQLAAEGFNRLHAEITNALKGLNDPDSKMKQYGLIYLRFSQQNEQLHSLMFESPEIEDAFLNSDHAPLLSEHYQLILSVTKERIEKWGYNVSPESLALATWCAFNGLSHTLRDRRLSAFVYNLFGEKDLESMDVKMAIADIVSDIFVGRL